MIGPRLAAAVVLLLVAGASQAAASGSTGAPGPTPPAPTSLPGDLSTTSPPGDAPADPIDAEAVDALLVRSWGWCGSKAVAWRRINHRWEELGQTRVHIDYAYRPACVGPVTYEGLVARGADVLILSNPAGGGSVLTESEISAIDQYVSDGHGAVATFLAFRHSAYDNSALAPLFGIQTTFHESAVSVRPTYRERDPGHPVFERIPPGYASSGYPFAQVPLDLRWSRVDRAEAAEYVGKAGRGRGAILVTDTAETRTLYVSHMPEYRGGRNDLQFLYNAITFVGGERPRPPGSSPQT